MEPQQQQQAETMAAQSEGAARENLRYQLTEDVTLWLRNNTTTLPVLLPWWSRRRGHPVFLQWPQGKAPTLGVAADTAEMRRFTHPDRLWFHIPRQILLEATAADPAWFRCG